ncbi:bacteriocin biosynthesis protein SagD [Halobacteriales archaeon QS_5_70_17]|nr:MAG: bacteriocin biosynthesis protein SagD [Halobacteriales archaeon QS_5_70_17]
MPTVATVGDGPAAAAVRATLEDANPDIEVRATAGIEEVGDADLAVVAAPTGAAAFAAAARSGRPWIAVELGGVGGHALSQVTAAVTGFAPETACYDCLRGRVASNLDGDAEREAAPDPDPAPADARVAGALGGRAAVRALSGEGSAFGTVRERPHARRRLLPLPHCDCAPERDRALRREHEPRDLEAALKRAERAVDPRIGIVREVGEVESFPVPYYLATLCDTSGFSDARASRQAAGVDPDWNAAFMKALGEALERYGAGVFRRSEFAGRPDATAVPLESFVLPEGTSAGAGGDGSAPAHGWVPGEDLHAGERVALPAPRVQFPLEGAGPTITTGLGLGNSGSEALSAGLAEVIERDAAMLAWYSTYEPLGLSISGSDAGERSAFEAVRRRARAEGLTLTPTLLTQDVDVPVVACAVHRDGEWPRFAVGTDAALDVASAAGSAACEALQNWSELRRMGRSRAADAGGRIGHFASLPVAARAFTDPETTIPADSVDAAVPPEGRLDALLDRVAEAGLDAYAARLTPRDVEALGFEAVRVLVPAAQPLFLDDPYFGERAERVPRELGFEPRPDREDHPFP